MLYWQYTLVPLLWIGLGIDMNIGLVLSGGMAKGAYQVGALQAISEYLKPEQIKYVSSASIGALNSYAFSSNNLSYARRMWQSINEDTDRLFILSVLRDGYLTRIINSLSENKTVCDKLYVPLFHMKSRNNFYVDISKLENPELTEYLNAAVAVFPICKPVMLENKFYYDGALIDNIPVFPLLKHRLDYIICIYFDEYNYMFESRYFDNKIIKITFDDNNQILSNSIWFSKDNTEYMFEDGYKKAKSILDFVFSSGTEDVEKIYSQIEVLNSFNPKKQIRITGDVAINNLNKVAKRLTHKRVIE